MAGICQQLLFLSAVLHAATAFPISQLAEREVEGLEYAEHVVQMRSIEGSAASSRYLANERDVQTQAAAGNSGLRFLSKGAGYGIDIQFGRELFTLIFDTGSSDMWLPTSNFQCVGPNKERVPTNLCGIGRTCNNGFSGGTISNQNFNITYGHGEFVTGTMGYEQVTIGGVTVPQQEAALVNYGFWMGDKQTSGLMGFSFPTLTSAYPGNDPSKDDRKTIGNVEYNPFIFNAIKQSGIQPMFGYAFERRNTGIQDGAQGGQLAIGGIPNVAHGPWTSTPIRIAALSPRAPPDAATQYTFYTIVPDGFRMATPPNDMVGTRDTDEIFTSYAEAINSTADSSDAMSYNVIVDSGTTIVYMPQAIATRFAQSTKPAATWNSQGHLYQVPCQGTYVPNFAVAIGGKDLWFNREDLLLTGQLGQDPLNPRMCNLGIQPAPGSPYVLGGTFLRSVVTVHDLGRHMMWFAQRI